MPFEMVSRVSPRNRVLDMCAHWHQLENTIELLCMAAMSWSATRGGE